MMTPEQEFAKQLMAPGKQSRGIKYEQAKPLLDELAQIAVLYHASSALKTKLFEALDRHIPRMDAACFERGCPMDDHWEKK